MTVHAPSVVPRLAPLDGLRAVAFLAVFLYHARVPGFGAGLSGVSVFFPLSGFVITRTLISERNATGRIDIGRFMLRRVRRLMPAALAAVACAVVVGGARGVTPRPIEVVAALTGWKNWQMFIDGRIADPLIVWWSLGVEEQFYLVYPVVLVALFAIGRTGRNVGLGLGVLAAASLAALLILTATDQSVMAYYGTHTRLWEILVGCLLAVVAPSRPIFPRSASIVAAVVLLACQMSWAAGTATFAHPLRTVVVIAASALLIDAGKGSRRTLTNRVLATRPMVWLGGISYEAYLLHTTVLLALGTSLGSVGLTAAVACLVTIGSAAVLHRLVAPFGARPSLAAPRSLVGAS